MNVSHRRKDLHRLQDGVWSWGGGEESEGAGGEDGQVELQGIISSGSSTIAISLIGDLSSPRAESARAVTGRRNSHRWEGGRLFEPSAGFFYGNSCNFGMKSRKIVSKVGN